MSALGVLVARVDEVSPGKSKKFNFVVGDRDFGCFIINWHGEFYAYVNRCRHVPMEMDWVENHFFDKTGALIVCPTHWACYAPDTGECVAGPAPGRRLIVVPLEIRGEEIFASVPVELESVDPPLSCTPKLRV